MKKVIHGFVIVVLTSFLNFTHADVVRGIPIDFVSIVNVGNSPNSDGCGAVNYNYRIGKYEVTNAQWNAFVNTTGIPVGYDDGYNYTSYWSDPSQPVNNVSWFEAAQFCNYLTTGDKSKGAYLFSGNNSNPGYFQGINREIAISLYGIVYVLPTEDEWYKAAYYKPDGSGYSLYANGLSFIPEADNGWNYSGGIYDLPWNVGTGTQEQNGTFDMMGNVWEWNESVRNNIYYFYRGIRGGSYYGKDTANVLASCNDYYPGSAPDSEWNQTGFRIVSIPEPASLALLGLGLLLSRRRK